MAPKQFSRWIRTALYVEGWAGRMPWTYRIRWVQDIGAPDHITPLKGSYV